MATEQEIHLIRTAVPDIMRAAGKLLLSYRFKPLKRTTKKQAGFVTEADVATEKFLVEALSKLSPNIGFIAEEHMHADRMETGRRAPIEAHPQRMGSPRVQGTPWWVIDPLDGTTNFIYGLPHFCISVALVENHSPVLGWVYQPVQDELFFAERGKGAWLNDNKISVSGTEKIEESFLVFCIPYKKNPESRRFFEYTITNLSQTASSLRLTGAAALDMAYVACGRFDGILIEQLYWWDIAAGWLLVTEAGGLATEFDGLPITPSYETLIAGNRHVHGRLVNNATFFACD